MSYPRNQPKVRLADMVGALCIAADLAMGQPMEHGLRRSLLAVWLGREIGLRDDEISSVLYVSLLGNVGCAIEGSVMAKYVEDEIRTGERLAFQDPSRPITVMKFFVGQIGKGDAPWERARKLGEVVALGPNHTQAIGHDVALKLGEFLGLGTSTSEALGQCMENWNGSGGPSHLKRGEISIQARLFAVARDAEVFSRLGGPEPARTMIKDRASRVYDPEIASRFVESAGMLLSRLDSVELWDAMLKEEPDPTRTLTPPEYRETARAVANFVDMRSRYTLGHSTGVSRLAEAGGAAIGLPWNECNDLAIAGLLHDLGRCGVPVTAWNREGALPDTEWERMKRHPSWTELVLARSAALGHLGTMAGLHHERLDGSGYRGVSAGSLPTTARVLAVADAYQTKLEPRPHRAALSPEAAAAELARQAGLGALDGDAVAAVLSAAGQPPAAGKRARPAGLSDREVEVLGLAVKGLSNRQIAEKLVVSPKTVGHHLESIYSKIGVSTRVGATLFALQHKLLEP